jgi:hypothetical protein
LRIFHPQTLFCKEPAGDSVEHGFCEIISQKSSL